MNLRTLAIVIAGLSFAIFLTGLISILKEVFKIFT